jgi:hypothetical protein
MQPKELGLPTTAYYTTDEIREVGSTNVPSHPLVTHGS